MSDGFAPVVTEVTGQGMVSVRAELAEPAIAEALRVCTGLAVPALREMTADAGRAIAWMSPDEVLLLCPASEVGHLTTALGAALADQFATVADVSDARVMFEVSGPGAREVLAKLTPVDLHPDQFGPGQMRRTRLAQVPAAVWMPAPGRLRVLCFRSVGQYVSDLLANAAAPGAALRVFAD